MTNDHEDNGSLVWFVWSWDLTFWLDLIGPDWTWLDHSGHGWKLKKKSFLQILDSNQLGCVYSVSRYGSIAVVSYHARAGPKRPRLAAPVQGAAKRLDWVSWTKNSWPMPSHATLGVSLHAKLPELPGRFLEMYGFVQWLYPDFTTRVAQIFENFVCVSYCIILYCICINLMRIGFGTSQFLRRVTLCLAGSGRFFQDLHCKWMSFCKSSRPCQPSCHQRCGV